jgi:hypothetical protein
MKRITKWQAVDGEEFDNKVECLDYEDRLLHPRCSWPKSPIEIQMHKVMERSARSARISISRDNIFAKPGAKIGRTLKIRLPESFKIK